LPETQTFVRDFVAKLVVPVVVDADALDAVVLRPGLVLTPHPGEMGRLVGQTAQAVQANRWEIARQFAREKNVTLVLKGAGTVVTDATGKLWINLTGNPGMAKGGMGDALTGIIGALLAQGLPALEAVKAGVFLHGCAGDLAAQRVSEPALLATDLIASLGAAIIRP
jgi:NAD(P)H-hydrate epimerase